MSSEKRLSIIAVVAAVVAMILAGVALLLPKGSGDDEPITIAGGSLRMHSSGWSVSGGEAKFTWREPVKTVTYACDGGNDSQPVFGNDPIPTEFQIKIIYSNGAATDPKHNTLELRVKDRAFVAKLLKTDDTTSVKNDALRFFLSSGEHVRRRWDVTSLEIKDPSGKLIGNANSCPSLKDFFLNIDF